MWVYALIIRDLKLATRNISSSLLPVGFLLICTSLFPLATEADTAFLAKTGAPVILLSILLASLLSLEHIFSKDMMDATIDQMIISGRSFSMIMLVRTFVHWLSTLLPMVLICPIPAVMYGLSFHTIQVLFLSLLITTPTLALVGTLGSAILTGSKQGNILLALIVLPLYIPLMILAGNATSIASIDGSVAMNIFLLMAFFFAAIVLAPYGANIALKQATRYE